MTDLWPNDLPDDPAIYTEADLDQQATDAGADPKAEAAIARSGVPIEHDPVFDPVDDYPERPLVEALSAAEIERRLADGTATHDDDGNLVLHKHPVNQED